MSITLFARAIYKYDCSQLWCEWEGHPANQSVTQTLPRLPFYWTCCQCNHLKARGRSCFTMSHRMSNSVTDSHVTSCSTKSRSCKEPLSPFPSAFCVNKDCKRLICNVIDKFLQHIWLSRPHSSADYPFISSNLFFSFSFCQH